MMTIQEIRLKCIELCPKLSNGTLVSMEGLTKAAQVLENYVVGDSLVKTVEAPKKVPAVKANESKAQKKSR